MRRRDFIRLLGGAAAWPMAARAQQTTRVPVIGFLSGGSARGQINPTYDTAFRRGLRENGFVEGYNVGIDYQITDSYDQLPAMAQDLVRRRVAVIVAAGASAVQPARAATSTIPIVFSAGIDPVALGLVSSLNRPGGNITGVTNLSIELGPKRLQLLHEIAPTGADLAALLNSVDSNAEGQVKDLEDAARALGVTLHIFRASSERDFESVFATIVQMGIGGLVIGNDTYLTGQSELLATLGLRYAVPTVFHFKAFAASGGLMSYGADQLEVFQISGAYAGRILKGERPADLPVQQVAKVELIINLKTAKALGVTLPITLLGRADEVIE